jgi:hypothetical protein
MATATPARIAAPMYDGTPPDVYVLGIYCRINERGVDKETIIAAKKKPKYVTKFLAAYRTEANIWELL